MKELAKMLHFTFEIYPSPDGLYGGETENGTWDGMIAELINKVRFMPSLLALRLNPYERVSMGSLLALSEKRKFINIKNVHKKCSKFHSI